MGCDIHMAVEKRIDGKWCSAGHVPMERCWACEGSGNGVSVSWVGESGTQKKVVEPTGKPCSWCKSRGWTVYRARRYDLFAILADVRNGYGFAGVLTGKGFVPISQPRGLPEDVDPKTGWNEEYNDHDFGDHSFSWLTLKELLDYDWAQVTTKQGMVSGAEYLIYKEKGRPTSWSGGVGGPGISIITEEEMEAKRLSGEDLASQRGPFGNHPSEGPAIFTTVHWKVTYAEAVGAFYTESIPALKKLASEVGGSENVRVVFGFDS